MNGVRRTPLSDQVAESILQYIQSHEMSVGDQIPTEKELADLFHVSRTTVREATKALSLNGMLRSVPGRGTFITKAGPAALDSSALVIKAKATIYEVMEVRVALMVKAAELAAMRGTPEDVSYLRFCTDSYELDAQAGQEYYEWGTRFFSRITEMSHNNLLVTSIQPLSDIMGRYRRHLAKNRTNLQEYIGSMRRLCNYFESRDSFKAGMEMNWHVELTAQSIIPLIDEENADSFLL